MSPKWGGNLRARYDHELANATTIFAQVSVNYVGSSVTQTIKAYALPLAAYAQADSAIGLKRDGWSAQLYVNNLTNKLAVTYASKDDNILLNSPSRPRTIGLRFNWAM